VHREHRSARADEVGRPNRRAGRGPQALDLLAQSLVLRGAVQRDREHIDLYGLTDEVVGAGADRTHRRVEAAKRREHDDGNVRPTFDDALTERDAVEDAQVQVGYDDVEVTALVHQGEGLVGGGSPSDGEVSTQESSLERLAQGWVVVDQKYAFRHGLRARRQVHGKKAPLAELALDGDPAAVVADDPVGHREA
jgi:hypothetical protein